MRLKRATLLGSFFNLRIETERERQTVEQTGRQIRMNGLTYRQKTQTEERDMDRRDRETLQQTDRKAERGQEGEV